MENPQKPTRNHEQERPKTLEDYAVKTFPADLDVTIRPLTVIRSGQDGGGIRHDGGWTPGDMLCLCDTDPEEGISDPELFLRVHKPVKVNDGEYVVAEKIIALSRLQGRKENDGFTESYIQELYGKSTEEMLKEGTEAAEQIWRQKHPVGSEIESLAPEVGSDLGAETSLGAETPSNSLVEDTSDHEKSLADKKVISAMGGLAAKATGIKKPADLAATEPVKKPVEADRASAAPADLPATKSVEKPVGANETNAGILPESFKSVINNFEKYTGGDNGEFSTETKSIARELNELKWRIQRNPEAIKEPATEGLIQRASSRIRDLEDSRAKSANKFKNNMDSLLEGLKSKIENDDELKRLVELTDHVDQMGVDNRVLGDLTNVLLNKLTIIRSIVYNSRNDRGGIIAYREHFVRVINEIIGSDDYRDIDRKFSGDLGSVYRRRQSILDAIKGIREAGY